MHDYQIMRHKISLALPSRRDNHPLAATVEMSFLIVAVFPSRLSRYAWRPMDDRNRLCVAPRDTHSPLRDGCEDEHSLHIPRHGYKAPLAARTVEPAQQELAEPQHQLDDSEHRLQRMLYRA